jgi:hypothetical protein
MLNKRPLQQQPVDKLLNLSTTPNPLYNNQMLSTGALEEINRLKQPFPSIPSAIPPTPISQPIPQTNVIRTAGLQMLPDEPKQPEDDSSNFLASLIAQGVAGIGTGLMGGSSKDIMNSANMFQYMRDQEASRNKAKLLMDPKSEESKKRREVFKKLGYNVPDNFSYTDLNDPTVLQTLKGQMEQSRLAAMPKGGIGVGKPKEEKEKKSPFQKEITEISIRSKNALDSLNKIENIVRQYGTRELTGSQEKELEQLIQNVAVNYNKVLDPTSVVREGEAKQVAESLGLGGFGSYFTNKDTALRQVQSFKDLVMNSRNNALSGYSNLPSDTDFNDEDQFVINEYRKNPDDPKIKETYNNMLKSKGLR